MAKGGGSSGGSGAGGNKSVKPVKSNSTNGKVGATLGNSTAWRNTTSLHAGAISAESQAVKTFNKRDTSSTVASSVHSAGSVRVETTNDVLNVIIQSRTRSGQPITLRQNRELVVSKIANIRSILPRLGTSSRPVKESVPDSTQKKDKKTRIRDTNPLPLVSLNNILAIGYNSIQHALESSLPGPQPFDPQLEQKAENTPILLISKDGVPTLVRQLLLTASTKHIPFILVPAFTKLLAPGLGLRSAFCVLLRGNEEIMKTIEKKLSESREEEVSEDAKDERRMAKIELEAAIDELRDLLRSLAIVTEMPTR